jgi:microcystin-dependent protein
MSIDKRPNYFDGQYLQDTDFIDEQQYHLDRQQRHTRLLHVSGIAEGLEISTQPDLRPTESRAADLKLTVKAGTAIAPDGKQIIILVDRTNLALPTTDGDHALFIQYVEKLVEPQEGGSATRVQEEPAIGFVTTAQLAAKLTEGAIPLAKLTITNGIVQALDLSSPSRQYSGLGLPSPSNTLSLRYNGTGQKLAAGQVELAVLSGSLSVTGNVGIGTTSPTSSLTIRKDAQAALGPVLTLSNHGGGAGAATAIDFNNYDVGTQNSTARIQSLDDGSYSSHIAVFTKAPGQNTNTLQERLRISANGNVGIGSPDPGEKLEVNGSLKILGSRIKSKDGYGIVQSDATDWLRINPDESYPAIALYKPVAIGTGGLAIGEWTTQSAGVLKVTQSTYLATAGGNVGIGTTSNESKLTINANIAHDNNFSTYGDAPLTIFEPTSNGGSTPSATRDILNLVREGVSAQAFGNKVSLAIGRYENSGLNSRTQLDIKLTDGSFSSHNTILSLRSNGNVGIGTTNPGAKLEINNGDLLLKAAAEDSGDIIFQSSTGVQKGRIWAQSTSGSGLFLSSGDNTPDITIDSSGNVGIGTTSAKSLLTIRKDAQAALGPVLTLSNHGGGAGAATAIDFNGYDVGTQNSTARIQSLDDGNYSSHLAISTKAPGQNTNTLQERLRISSNGNVDIGSSTVPVARVAVNNDLVVNLATQDYTIELIGASLQSTEGNTNSLKVNNVAVTMDVSRGINSVILNPNGTFKNKTTHDLWGSAARWNDWAQWVNTNAANGDVIAVASSDAVQPVPAGGAAETLLKSIGAVHALRSDLSYRIAYALLFVKGLVGAREMYQPVAGPNAKILTTYKAIACRIDFPGTITASQIVGNGAIITGMIVMWSGAVANIPIGWALCNGQNGTPDLRDRFIVGAGNAYAVSNTGGADSVTLTTNHLPAHDHANGNYRYLMTKTGTGTYTGSSDNTPGEPHMYSAEPLLSVGGNAAHENRPPYYALCFIMKL